LSLIGAASIQLEKATQSRIDLQNFLQNCLQLADMRQGTTSVVPQWPITIPALAAAEVQTTEKEETQGLKPTIFLLSLRHD